VITFRFGPGQSVLRSISGTQPEAVRLDAVIAGPFFARPVPIDARQQPAGRIARRAVRIDWLDELMVNGPAGLHAIERFTVLRVGFAADVIAHASGRHQVAFIGGVDEHLAAERLAAFHGDGANPAVLLLDAGAAVETLTKDHRHVALSEHIAK